MNNNPIDIIYKYKGYCTKEGIKKGKITDVQPFDGQYLCEFE